MNPKELKMLLPTPPFKESVFTPDVRRYISRLVYDFEMIVRERSQGKASILFINPLIIGDDEIIGITLLLGKGDGPFQWEDERDDSFDTDVIIKIFQKHLADSTVSFYYPGAKEPFHIAPLHMDSLGDAFAVAVPELFPEKLETPEKAKTKKKHKRALPS